MFLYGILGKIVSIIIRLAVVVAIAIAIFLAVTNMMVITTSSKDIVNVQASKYRGADAIVVLGASVFEDGTPSTILKDRLDDAVILYGEGAAPKIIVSGDNGDLSYNESAAMKRYLVSQGIPSSDVFCDYAGFNTYDTMYRARHVFGCESIVIATQTYHLYRAIYDAHALGMEAVGVPSDYHVYQKQNWYDLREIGARAKGVVNGFLKVPSKFVGDPIDITGSGDIV